MLGLDPEGNVGPSAAQGELKSIDTPMRRRNRPCTRSARMGGMYDMDTDSKGPTPHQILREGKDRHLRSKTIAYKEYKSRRIGRGRGAARSTSRTRYWSAQFYARPGPDVRSGQEDSSRNFAINGAKHRFAPTRSQIRPSVDRQAQVWSGPRLSLEPQLS